MQWGGQCFVPPAGTPLHCDLSLGLSPGPSHCSQAKGETEAAARSLPHPKRGMSLSPSLCPSGAGAVQGGSGAGCNWSPPAGLTRSRNARRLCNTRTGVAIRDIQHRSNYLALNQQRCSIMRLIRRQSHQWAKEGAPGLTLHPKGGPEQLVPAEPSLGAHPTARPGRVPVRPRAGDTAARGRGLGCCSPSWSQSLSPSPSPRRGDAQSRLVGRGAGRPLRLRFVFTPEEPALAPGSPRRRRCYRLRSSRPPSPWVMFPAAGHRSEHRSIAPGGTLRPSRRAPMQLVAGVMLLLPAPEGMRCQGAPPGLSPPSSGSAAPARHCRISSVVIRR